MRGTQTAWEGIVSLAGEVFHTKTGKAFTYQISGNAVALLNTNRNLPRAHIERALGRMPLDGPGQLQDLQGPSYIFAIITDPRVSGGRDDLLRPVPSPRQDIPQLEGTAVTSAISEVPRRPGTPVTEPELRELGFVPHELRFLRGDVPLPGGVGLNWDTLGEIPDSPGLYAFTTEDPTLAASLRVAYVGLSTHLWMIAKGQLPGGVGRGGQRYGRPKHAGVTRKRVNVEVAGARAEGLHVRHWLRPMTVPPGAEASTFLRHEEERLILMWALRTSGWNRG